MSPKRNKLWVVSRPEHLETLDLVGRVGIKEAALHQNVEPSVIHNRIYRIRDRLEQGQNEINKLRGLMKKYPLVRRLLTPKTLRPTERDLEPDLYEDEEEEN